MKTILSLVAAAILSATAAQAADIETYFEQQSFHGGNLETRTGCSTDCLLDSEVFQGD